MTRRLGAGLAVSLALHLALLGLAGRQHRPVYRDWPQAPALTVEILPISAPERPPPPRPAPSVAPGKEAAARTAEAKPPEPEPAIPGVVPEAKATATVRAALDLDVLLAAARALARETAASRDREELVPAGERPILPLLARAMQRETAGERRLADGLVRVVTADGRAFCLQAPPGVVRGDIVDPLAVTVTCP